MLHISGIQGTQYSPDDKGYAAVEQQYASSTYQKSRDLSPGLIVMASSMSDIQTVVSFVNNNNKKPSQPKIAIAVRTGGHQYSGASSTNGSNIQLDLSNTFKGPNDFNILPSPDGKTAYVRTSISWSLKEFIGFLTSRKLFVPTGQCSDVHLGGHVQTGGYGQLSRSFGLLADQVVSLEIVDYEGKQREITKVQNPDMFYGLLGGSPGNFGILTHVSLLVYRDQDYQGSVGLRAYHFYTKQKFKYLLDILVNMSDKGTFPKNYDLCITVKSVLKLSDYDPDFAQELLNDLPEGMTEDDLKLGFSGIAVYAQWVKLNPSDQPDMDWFRSLKKTALFPKGPAVFPMSQMVNLWLFHPKREFRLPYVKRTLVTNSSSLGAKGWPVFYANHIDSIINGSNGLHVVSQIQCAGGSQATNANNGTCYSWRKDSTLGLTCDCFYQDDATHLKAAQDWQAKTDSMIGPTGSFAQKEMSLLWGSYGEWDMKIAWKKYYESEEMYQRLQKIRKVADPNGVFTPNVFCVPAAP